MTYYLIGGDGQRYGPEEVSVLAQWAREGRLIHGSVLIEAEAGTRLTAGQIPELARELGPAPVSAPPPVAPVPPRPPHGIPRAVPAPIRPLYPVEMVGPKSKIVAGLLGIFFGVFGLHRFYLGYAGIGALQLFLTLAPCFTLMLIKVPAVWLWGFIEGVLCLTGNMRDAQGRRLRD